MKKTLNPPANTLPNISKFKNKNIYLNFHEKI